jgi:hypothetical protein
VRISSGDAGAGARFENLKTDFHDAGDLGRGIEPSLAHAALLAGSSSSHRHQIDTLDTERQGIHSLDGLRGSTKAGQ